MGMGEPLLNLPAVAAAYHLLHDGLGLSGRAITISTVGVPNAIRKLAAMRLPVTLAVSIHAPNQELRERLIPSAKVYPLEALMQVGGPRADAFAFTCVVVFVLGCVGRAIGRASVCTHVSSCI